MAELRKGPRTNRELIEFAMKYTSRISDIRAWLKEWEPQTIVKTEKLGGGLHLYSLVDKSKGIDSGTSAKT